MLCKIAHSTHYHLKKTADAVSVRIGDTEIMDRYLAEKKIWKDKN